MTDIPWRVGETYRTADGTEARIYATDGGGEHPIHGAYKVSDGWEPTRWTVDGEGSAYPNLNLLPPPKTRVQGWLNIYKDRVVEGLFDTKEEAEAICEEWPEKPTACVYIDVEEGHGL